MPYKHTHRKSASSAQPHLEQTWARKCAVLIQTCNCFSLLELNIYTIQTDIYCPYFKNDIMDCFHIKQEQGKCEQKSREKTNLYISVKEPIYFRVILGCVFSWVLFVYLLVSFAILMSDTDLHSTEVADTTLCLFPLNTAFRASNITRRLFWLWCLYTCKGRASGKSFVILFFSVPSLHHTVLFIYLF